MTKEGTVLDGKYEILAEVGRGGMSIVYLARDKRLNKQWAVKEIKNDGKKSAKTLLKGLEREANILKNVDHPVLPRIVDIINQDGTIYVVMDYIEGDTIQDRLKKEGAQPQELVVEWGLQLASALNYLHNMNPPIIYRDMKPSNVMIKPEGGVKLIDFGTAKEYEIENNADTTALGTRGYAAPEQFGFGQSDKRTDIYALGVLINVCLTGQLPKDKLCTSHGFREIVKKCTNIEPQNRYNDVGELMNDIMVVLGMRQQSGNQYKKSFLDSQLNIAGIKPNSRFLPGFRTLIWWKMITAVLGYGFMVWLTMTMNMTEKDNAHTPPL